MESGFVMLVCAQEQDGLITTTSEIHLAIVAVDRSTGLGMMYVLFGEIGLALNPYLTPKLDSAQATEAAFPAKALIVSFVKPSKSEVLARLRYQQGNFMIIISAYLKTDCGPQAPTAKA